MANRKFGVIDYTQAEDAILHQYRDKTAQQIHDEHLPHRTVSSIQTRRNKLHLPKIGHWQSDAERANPIIPPQPGEITHREIDGRKIAVVWGDDGVPMPKPACWEPSRDGMFSALYRRNQSSPAVVPLALPAAQLGGPVAS